ncbi:MAG: hypothetical protein WC823_02930 [Parcubacteria group bacterium]|jgi:hypothetical protein
MLKKIDVLGVTVVPVNIYEKRSPALYAMFNNLQALNAEVFREVEVVLQIMIDVEFTMVPDRKAVYFYQEIHLRAEKSVLKAKAGTTFPLVPAEFESNCEKFCEEKVLRTLMDCLVCSHQNRNPNKSEWGGSARIVFRLIPIEGEQRIITIIGAASGCKEWEDLAIFLGALYKKGLIRFEYPQVRDILAKADASVVGQPDCLPKIGSITKYVGGLFAFIELE